MICPFRKQTKKSVDVTSFETVSEYYMECYGEECPFYIHTDGIDATAYCDRADATVYFATHLGGKL